ncbi:MAG: biopolymer transporter ExbD [Pseudomonadota bacterium]
MAAKVASGGGDKRSRGGTPTSEPNVIPFIDILLVLLIIFMVTAPIPTVDLRVDLPPPNPVPIHLEGLHPTMIVIQETPNHQIFVDQEPVTMDTLADVTFQHAIQNNPALNFEQILSDAKIFVRADQSTAYSNVVDVMSKLQQADFVQVGIFAETAQEG